MSVMVDKYFRINEAALEGSIDRFLKVPENHDDLVRNSEKYRNVKYPVVITGLPDGEWLAEHPDLPGCKAHGKTPAEAEKTLEEIKLSWIYMAMAEGNKIPEPSQNVQIASTV
ncbi:MAG: type II toxin-antitoxin system HicB family antitoxin [Actinobacteria bacterium]|nr:type II toxin-antitoxin system HicB family antitoxin [Actinomycetota bacterium]